MKEIIKDLIVDTASRALEEKFPVLRTIGRWCCATFLAFFVSLFATDVPRNKKLNQ